MGAWVLDIGETSRDREGHAILERASVFCVENHGRVPSLNTNASSNVLDEFLNKLRLLRLDHGNGLDVRVLRGYAILELLDDSLVDIKKQFVCALLGLVGVHKIGSGDHRGVCLVAQAEGRDNDTGVQIAVVRVRGKLQIVVASAHDSRADTPVQLYRIEVCCLHLAEELVVINLVRNLVGECSVGDLLVLVQNVRHLVDKVVGHDVRGSVRGVSDRAQLVLIFHAHDGRQRRADVHLLDFLADLSKCRLPLLYEGSSRELFRDDAHLLARTLDDLQAALELLLVLRSILSSDEDLHWSLTILEWLQICGLLLCRDDVHALERDDEERRWELVAKQPELKRVCLVESRRLIGLAHDNGNASRIAKDVISGSLVRLPLCDETGKAVVEGCLVDAHFVRHLGRRTPVKLSRCGKG